MRVIGDSPQYFEPQSGDKNDTRAILSPSPNYYTTSTRKLRATIDLTRISLSTRQVFSGIETRTLDITETTLSTDSRA
ncbi:hypothetical protein TNCV_2082811 [Trichonephila clavipes]|nr:hypothetical protein TNCV_2082811 [Trichonephila clavipes]